MSSRFAKMKEENNQSVHFGKQPKQLIHKTLIGLITLYSYTQDPYYSILIYTRPLLFYTHIHKTLIILYSYTQDPYYSILIYTRPLLFYTHIHKTLIILYSYTQDPYYSILIHTRPLLFYTHTHKTLIILYSYTQDPYRSHYSDIMKPVHTYRTAQALNDRYSQLPTLQYRETLHKLITSWSHPLSSHH